MTLPSNSPMNPVSGLKGYSFPFPNSLWSHQILFWSSVIVFVCRCLITMYPEVKSLSLSLSLAFHLSLSSDSDTYCFLFFSREAQSGSLSRGQLQAFEGRQRLDGRRDFPLLCSRLVYRMGMRRFNLFWILSMDYRYPPESISLCSAYSFKLISLCRPRWSL